MFGYLTLTPLDTPPSSPPFRSSNITPSAFLGLFPVWYPIFQELKRANPVLLSRLTRCLHTELNHLIYHHIILDKSLPAPRLFSEHWISSRYSEYDPLHLVESLSIIDLKGVFRLLRAIHRYRHSWKYARWRMPLFPKLRHLHFGSEMLWACGREEEVANDAEVTPEGRDFITLGEGRGWAWHWGGMMAPQQVCLEAMLLGNVDADVLNYRQAVNNIVSGMEPLERVTWHIPGDKTSVSWDYTYLVDGAREVRWDFSLTGEEDSRRIIMAVEDMYIEASGDYTRFSASGWPKGVKRSYVVPYSEGLEKLWWRRFRCDSELFRMVVLRERDGQCECRRLK